MARPPSGSVLERRGTRGTVYALRFRAYGQREYLTLNVSSTAEAEAELANVLADVRRGIWRPAAPPVVEAPKEEPTLHLLASEWLERRKHEVDDRTVEHWRWALSCHLLPPLAQRRSSEITAATIDNYKTAKLVERERLEEELRRWKAADPATRGERPPRPLSNGSINKTLMVLAMVLDDAVEFGYLAANPARGRKRRLKAARPRRTWLELDEVRSVLDAAGNHRALLATLTLAGLRVGELCQLRWRAVDLARGTLTVEESKTEAGEGRKVDLTPMLLGELKLHRATTGVIDRDALVFRTATGGQRDRHNVRSRILLPTIGRANAARAKAGQQPIQEGITNHTCRRTFASLLYEAGASPAYVMAQMGHESAKLALEVYARKMERQRDTGARMDALIKGADWAQMGTSGADTTAPVPAVATGDSA
jgi:integrase